MRHYRQTVLALLILFAFALPVAARPARSAESAVPGLRWVELWQSLIASFTVLTGEGRAIWDPNGGDSAAAPPPSTETTVDDMADGGGLPL